MDTHKIIHLQGFTRKLRVNNILSHGVGGALGITD